MGGHTLLRQSLSSTLTHRASPKPYLIIHLKDCLLNALSLRGVTLYSRGFQPGVRGPLVVRDGIAGGPRHEPMLIGSPLNFFYFYKFALIFQHISRLLLYIVKNIEDITLTSATGGISVQGEGAWWRRRRRLQTRRLQTRQWAANYFLVRMVVPGTK